jgi:hypothetical protein
LCSVGKESIALKQRKLAGFLGPSRVEGGMKKKRIEDTKEDQFDIHETPQ